MTTRPLMRFVAIVLSGVLLASSLPAAPVRKKVSKWTQGTRIQVEFRSGPSAIGRLGPVSADGFTLNPDKKVGTPREVRFDEVRRVSTKMSTRDMLICIGVVWVILGVLGMIVGG